MKDHQQERDILNRYLAGQSDAAEKDRIDQWYIQRAAELYDQLPAPDYADAKTVIWQALQVRNKPTAKLYPYLRIAAAIAAVILGVWLYTSYHSTIKRTANILSQNDIAPGKNTATLILADGKVINLDTNRTSVIATDSVQTMMMLTASTPRGGTYQVILPDGTKVWLNADSKIHFPSKFAGKERKVVITGEAYFEVAKNTMRPFYVSVNKMEIKVLGTHFNINAYDNESNVQTTLLEGAIAVSLPSGTTKSVPVVLKPGQQTLVENAITRSGTSNSTAAIKLVNNANIDKVMAWKNGLFYFEEASLAEIMRQVERWYDIEVVYANDIPNIQFVGEMTRGVSLKGLLIALEKSDVHFTMEGRKLIVQP